MTICFFGTYIRSYSRNKIIMDGLRANGHTVTEVNTPNPQTKLDNTKHVKFLAMMERILRKLSFFPLLIKSIPTIRKADILFVGFPGHLDIPIAYLTAKIFRKKFIFDPTVSLYTMLVEDFMLLKPDTVLARIILFLERMLYKLPDAILSDTPIQSDYYLSLLGVPAHKLYTLPIGADASIYSFSGFKKKTNEFVIIYYGMYNPLHGVEHIIRAADLLKSHRDIKFLFIGDGQTYPASVALANQLQLTNIVFYKDMREKDAILTLQTADIFLGFVQDIKTVQRQLPNKVFQGMALGKAVVTVNTAAVRSVFHHGEDIYLILPSNPQSLADAIMELKNNDALRKRIAKHGYDRYSQEFTPIAIGKQFSHILQNVRYAREHSENPEAKQALYTK